MKVENNPQDFWGYVEMWRATALLRGWRGRLSGSFLLVILLSIGTVAVVVGLFASLRLDEVGVLASRRRAFRLAPFFADTYQQTGSWQGASRLVERFNEPLPPQLFADIPLNYPARPDLIDALGQDRLLLVGTDGLIVADSQDLLSAGQPILPDLSRYAVPILVQGQPVGALLVVSGLEQQISTLVLTALERTLWGAGLLAATLALLVSLGLAQRLVNPLQRLSLAARQLASGENSNPLPIESKDELGDLTQAFNEMTAALNRQKYLRRQMVADIAHELRTPLSIMQLELESLVDGLQTPAEAAASLQDEVDALNRLVEDLRLLSLADAGGLQFTLEVLDVSIFLQQMRDSWAAKAQAQQVQLLSEVTGPLPPVYADEGRLTQVFNNLLGNALRYTPAGQTLTLGGRVNYGELLLWVTDNGPGLSPEDLPYVFERFYRADPSRSRDTGGSGLGLAIAKQWIALHGGRIWVESEPGKGATFYVALPVASKLDK